MNIAGTKVRGSGSAVAVWPRRSNMCDHRINRQVQRSHQGPSERQPEHTFACEAYTEHAVELHRIVSRMVECKDCADTLVAHAFLVRLAVRGVQPTLAQLTRTALVFACSALGDIARQQLQARIRIWYISSNTDPSSPEFMLTPG